MRVELAGQSAQHLVQPGDLQPGWRIRVVIPLTKSGKYKVETSTTQTSGNTIELKASDDLLGYEEDFYEVNRSIDMPVDTAGNIGSAAGEFRTRLSTISSR